MVALWVTWTSAWTQVEASPSVPSPFLSFECYGWYNEIHNQNHRHNRRQRSIWEIVIVFAFLEEFDQGEHEVEVQVVLLPW